MSAFPGVAVIIGGVNGAGKTTFARQMLALLHPGVPYFNVDEIQRESTAFSHPVAASKEFMRRLHERVDQGGDFAIETTLSSVHYLKHIAAWRSRGYSVILHFIEVPSPDFAVERVLQRVRAGGHNIPEADIRRRFLRSKQLFHAAYAPVVDRWYHWNSDEKGLSLVTQTTGRNP